jgi:hypothetical protein
MSKSAHHSTIAAWMRFRSMLVLLALGTLGCGGDGGRLTRLTDDLAAETMPDWSPVMR